MQILWVNTENPALSFFLLCKQPIFGEVIFRKCGCQVLLLKLPVIFVPVSLPTAPRSGARLIWASVAILIPLRRRASQ
jgi:hypothetical protein